MRSKEANQMFRRFVNNLRWPLVAAVATFVLVASSAGAAVQGDPLKLGVVNTINLSTALTGGSPGPQLKVSNTSPSYPAIRAEATGADAGAYALFGLTTSTAPSLGTAAVRGVNTSTNSHGIGVWGTQSGSGTGVEGNTPSGVGVWGQSTNGTGVVGATTSAGSGVGVRGETSSSAAGVSGVFGQASSGSAAADSAAVRGVNSGKGMGVYGYNPNNVASGYGVAGKGRYGLVGTGLFSGASSGVYGTTAGGFAGVEGHSGNASGYGVYGDNSAGGDGIFGSSGNGRGVEGRSDTGQGVYGYSSQNAGVVGDSLNFDGVYGVSHSGTHAAVSAHNDVWGGFGLWAAGGDVGNKTAAIHGQSEKGNAVEGISQKDIASGVYGENDSSGYGVAGRANNGTGVLADSSNGWALKANGNATQGPVDNGFLKAMLYVNPKAADPIQRCFNSQLPPSQATNGHCGFTYTDATPTTYKYNFDIDVGFPINGRFISVSPDFAVPAGARAFSVTVARVDIGNNVGFYLSVY